MLSNWIDAIADNLQFVLIAVGMFCVYVTTYITFQRNLFPETIRRPNWQPVVEASLLAGVNTLALAWIGRGAGSNFVIVSAFLFVFGFITSVAIFETLARQMSRWLAYLGGLGVSTLTTFLLSKLSNPDVVASVFVMLMAFVYLLMMTFANALMANDEKHKNPVVLLGFNYNNLFVTGLTISMSGILMIRVFSTRTPESLMVVLTGFLYLYTILFSTSNSVNSFRLRVPGALSTAQTYGIGLGIGLTYAGVLWVGWVLGASGNFLISFSLVALYAYLLADNFYLMFVPRHHLTLRDHLRVAGLGWGILVGSLPVAWYVVDQEMSVLVRAIAGLMTIYMLTIISAGVESAFIAKKRDARIGTLTGGILSLALGIGLMVACIEYLKTTAFATLVTDLHRWIMDNIVDQGWVIDLGDLLDLQDKQNVADLSAVMIVITLYLGVALGGSWVLGQALKSLLAQGTATRNTQRTFVFYKLSTFLMTPVELILLPIQNRMGNNPMAYFFILPNMLVFGVFILMPMILNFFFGFTESRSFLPINRWADSGGQIQTQNLQDILTCKNYADPITCEEDLFWRSVRNTFFYVNFQVVSMVLLALITALALNRNIILRGFFRSIFFYPVLLSPVVVAYIWIWILDFDSGLINSLLENLGRDRILFLGNPRNKFWSQLWVIVVADWAFMGFYTLILLAGLQSIPAALYEAAQIDGASSWGQFRHITLPLLMPTMTVVLVLSLIRAVQVFDQVFVLTGGGPGTATHYLVQYIYRSAFEASPPDYGLASSASLLLGIVLFIATMTQLFLARRTEAA